MNKTRRKNLMITLHTCLRYGLHHGDKNRLYARRLARLTVMAELTESNLYNYGNAKVVGSLDLPYDKKGDDHDSVGILQQRPEYWYGVRQCQTVSTAVRNFLLELGHVSMNRKDYGAMIQEVQRSYDPTGNNYTRNRIRSWYIINRYWKYVHVDS